MDTQPTATQMSLLRRKLMQALTPPMTGAFAESEVLAAVVVCYVDNHRHELSELGKRAVSKIIDAALSPNLVDTAGLREKVQAWLDAGGRDALAQATARLRQKAREMGPAALIGGRAQEWQLAWLKEVGELARQL